MRRAALFILIVICVLTADTSAWALPPPMSPAELFAASDLVALVRVLSVTCVAIIHGREDLRRYTAELGVLKPRKGELRRYDIVEVQWEEIPRDVLGPWSVAYHPGGKGWTHLVWQDGICGTTWWNAADDWSRRGARKLPQQVMETKRASLPTRAPFRIVSGWRMLKRAVFQAH
jgi:hypothetical protein